MASDTKDKDTQESPATVQFTPSSTEEQKLFEQVENEVKFGIIFNIFIGYPIILIFLIYTFYKICTCYVPYCFIDEKFHVTQTIKYIEGQWKSWDPKITTPPGLYILGWLNYKIFKSILHLDWSTLTILRLVNLFGGCFIWPIFVLRPIYLFNALSFWPVTLVCFPLMATYYSLYYTDVWSSIIITAALATVISLPFGETGSIWFSSFLCFISLFFRQTNIIWNLFIMVLVIERRAIIQRNFNTVKVNNYLKLIIHSIESFSQLCLPYIINMVLFLIFVIYNGSLTLGDKQNHVAGFHVVQLFYCYTFMTFFSLPLWISRQHLLNYATRFFNSKRWIFEFIGIIIIIKYFTVTHPFLLADNRHYTFYIFKKIFGKDKKIYKYFFCPIIYHFSIFTIHNLIEPSIMKFHSYLPIEVKEPIELPSQLTHISFTTLMLCTFLTTTPSPLFEPRYYILPYVFWRVFVTTPFDSFWQLNSIRLTNRMRLVMEFLWFILLNVVTYLVFIKYEFTWDTEKFPQRIIW
ncbi:dolichyl-P-Glc:Glc(2)Man(9)GlcNAc(2)-PP-dolichol alpha-1,2- glucosyltransferase SCDLUD_004496 [Saccharomycodes ludwigii]|uniref:dolichyl-P-Glc:Glc(2)Man(9)GlcNAc(2)-PP-dolichol alpha-1,2- glucosyltransferase n=1 Tax=Saccharomycodes ludwigii TaxID=36035 RepID=UPI001E855017|nr:hypothetical protein SCDLUD_004496 [Saccharomycodes ludwigii]KAH3899073.1 hypothetical protein SCDLUD_004496 [Saccharomycodes ludwigii]